MSGPAAVQDSVLASDSDSDLDAALNELDDTINAVCTPSITGVPGKFHEDSDGDLDDALNALDETLKVAREQAGSAAEPEGLDVGTDTKAYIEALRKRNVPASANKKDDDAEDDDSDDSDSSEDSADRPPPRRTTAKTTEDEEDLGDICSTGCITVCALLVSVIIGLLLYRNSGPPDPLDTRVVKFKGDGVLRTVVWPGQSGGAQQGVYGPNGRETDWAVFFYKPYCGACQVRALTKR